MKITVTIQYGKTNDEYTIKVPKERIRDFLEDIEHFIVTWDPDTSFPKDDCTIFGC